MRARTARLRPRFNRGHRHRWQPEFIGGMHWEDVCRCGRRRLRPVIVRALEGRAA